MSRLAWALATAAIGTQIAYPLTTGTARDAVTVAVVVLLAGTCAVHAADTRGWRWAGGMLAVTAGGGLLIEVVGIATGVPFGGYLYAPGRLGPVVAGVPVIIGLAWTAGAYPAWCVAGRVTRGSRARVLLAAAGLAAWDLYLDPQMVADGRWHWTAAAPDLPGLPGIPLSNFLGWAATALVMMLALHRLPGPTRPHRDAVPVLLYLWTWLGSALAQAVFLDLRVSALYGLAAMGVLGAPLLVDLRRAAGARAGLRPSPLARWARASEGERTLASAAGGGARHPDGDRGSAAQRLSARADDDGRLRR